MSTCFSEKRIEKWHLDKLKPHPKQSQIFQPATPEEIADLAQLMKTQPSSSLVEILPDGTLICGNSRLQAARQLGWTEIEVWIREDLEEKGPGAVERRLIEDNVVRKQLSPLDKARCTKALFDLEKNDAKTTKGKGNLRDIIAKKHNMSGRNLERYLNVLKTPMEVQQAFDENKLSLDEASRVAGMTAVKQQEVVNAITQGKKVRDVIRELEDEKEKWSSQPGNDITSYLRPLATWNRKMVDRLPKITSVTSHDLQTITKAIDYLTKLAQKADPPKDEVKQEVPQAEAEKEAPQVEVEKEAPQAEIEKEVPQAEVEKEVPQAEVEKELLKSPLTKEAWPPVADRIYEEDHLLSTEPISWPMESSQDSKPEAKKRKTSKRKHVKPAKTD